MWPQWTAVVNHIFHPGEYVESLQLDVIPGYSVVVTGGRRHGPGEAGHVWVEDGELLEIVLRRTGDITPTQEAASTSGSDGGEGEESSPAEDPLPDSADFSPHEPGPNEGPRGPLPPRPVNERSRSPARRPAELLRLAEAVPVPTFDLTQQSLPLPAQPRKWLRDMQPWPTSWIFAGFGGLMVKQITKEALQKTVAWQDLLNPSVLPDSLDFQIYTDGSAMEKPARSGYAVTCSHGAEPCYTWCADGAADRAW